jgi:hypothetical protein
MHDVASLYQLALALGGLQEKPMVHGVNELSHWQKASVDLLRFAASNGCIHFLILTQHRLLKQWVASS